MTQEKFFRSLTRPELDVVLGWAAHEGWNPGLRDADAFWAADREAFVGIEMGGELVGSGAIVSYGGKAGFMGLFIVKPAFRGKGLGREFWYYRRDRLLRRLGKGAAICMDGVFAMQPFYAEGGFVFTHRNLRMEGRGRKGTRDSRLVDLSTLPFEQVEAYDRLHFRAPRTAFLKNWIFPDGGLALGFMDGDRLAGCGVARPCHTGFKVGPLFADNPEIADHILTALSDEVEGEPLFLDTPENNPEALALAARHGMKEVFGCARMVLGPIPDLPWRNIYGVTTFELG